MTRWSHEEVGDLYRRAERAERMLLKLVEKLVVDGAFYTVPVEETLEEALNLLHTCPLVEIKNKLKELGYR